MKASELRIGNYIKLMFNYEDYELLQVTLNDLVDVDKKRADFEPLSLTEELLYKFGFKNIDKGDNDDIAVFDGIKKNIIVSEKPITLEKIITNG